MRDGWIETPIGDVAQVLSGFAFKSELFNKSEGIPLIRIRDLPKRNSTEALYSGNYEDRYIVKKGDFLIGMDGEFHCYEWKGVDALLNQRVCRIQDFKLARVIPRYIYFAVNQYLDKIEQDTGYTTVKHISAKQVLGITIPLPPLPEQKRIVDLISSVDSYIEALQQQLYSAKRSRNAVLHELLTAGSADWVSGIVGDISDLRYGFTESANWDPIGPKFLRITDIQDGSVDWDSVPYCQISDSEKEAQLLEDGDLVFARTGATTGKSFLVTKPPVSVCASYLIRLRPNQSKVNPHYLSIFFQSEDYWSQVMAGTSGSAQGGVNASKLSKLKIDIPPLSIQTEISEIIQEMDNYTFGLQKAIRKSQDLRSGLLNELLSGVHEIPSTYDKVIGAA